jgi:hypothetical protein
MVPSTVPALGPPHPYLGHGVMPPGYGLNGSIEEGAEEGGDMDKGREEIGHYDGDMGSQTGPIRGYPRADGFVWRPY